MVTDKGCGVCAPDEDEAVFQAKKLQGDVAAAPSMAPAPADPEQYGPDDFCQKCIMKFDENGGCNALHKGDGDAIEAAIPSEKCGDECNVAHILSYCGIHTGGDTQPHHGGPSNDDFCYKCVTDFDSLGGCAAMHNGDEKGIEAAITDKKCEKECDFEMVQGYCGL